MSASSTVLRGEDHPNLGEQAVRALGDRTALGISAGRLPKPYWHLDPNEDGALAVASADRVLLAVADGHNGADASHAALAAVREAAEAADAAVREAADAGQTAGPIAAEVLLEAVLSAAARAVEVAVAAAIAAGDEQGRADSRTALSVAIVDDGTVHAATWGDTVALRIRGGRRTKVKALTGTLPFLGPRSERPPAESSSLRSGDRIVLCSDGITDHLGSHWDEVIGEAAAAQPGAEALATDLLERAAAGGAGDHLAVAVTIVP